MRAPTWRDRVFGMPVLMTDIDPYSKLIGTDCAAIRLVNRLGTRQAVSWPLVPLPDEMEPFTVCKATVLELREDFDREPIALVHWRTLETTRLFELISEDFCPIPGTVAQTCELVKSIELHSLRRLGHEAIGYRALQPALTSLREVDEKSEATLGALLSGAWKRSCRHPAASLGEIVRAMDRFSAARGVGNAPCGEWHLLKARHPGKSRDPVLFKPCYWPEVLDSGLRRNDDCLAPALKQVPFHLEEITESARTAGNRPKMRRSTEA